MLNRKRWMKWVSIFGLLVSSSNAQAIDSFDLTDLTNLTNDAVGDLLKTFGYGADYRPYEAASALGVSLGVEIGAEVSLITLPDSFKTALTLVGNTGTVPNTVPLPRLIIRKGLPMGIDIGFNYIGLNNDSIWGLGVKWNFMNSKRISLAGRASYSKSTISFIQTKTFTFDALASIKLFVIEPYLGLGYQISSGDIDLGQTGLTFPAGVDGSASFSSPRFFIGLPLHLLFLDFAVEYTNTLGSVSSIGIKTGLSF